MRNASVTVSLTNAEQCRLLWLMEMTPYGEFGSGVYHNGSVGTSPNPYGDDLGLTIGSYGKGHGKQTAL